MVDSNKEHGEGRSDVVLYDSINGRVAVFEAKYTKALGKSEFRMRQRLTADEREAVRKGIRG